MKKLKNNLQSDFKDFKIFRSNGGLKIKHKIKDLYDNYIYIKRLTPSWVSIYTGNPNGEKRILDSYPIGELGKIKKAITSYFYDLGVIVPKFIKSVKELFGEEIGNIDELLSNYVRYNKIRPQYNYYRKLSGNRYTCKVTEGGEGIVKWHKNDFNKCIERYFCLENDNYIIKGYRFNPTFFNDMFVIKFWDKITEKIVWKTVYASHVYNPPAAFQCCKVIAMH